MPLPPSLEGRLSLPAVAAPMFLVSGPELVIAASEAGVIGAFPSLNARPAEEYVRWLGQIERALAASPGAAPFAVNLIVHRSNKRLEQDLAATVAHRVPIVITSVGHPGEVVARVHAYGGLVWHDVIHLHHAHKAAAAGVDGLILVAAGAGGHAGTLSPFAFLRQVRAVFDRTIVLAGAITDGAGIAAARVLGADLAYLGTRFIASRESRAPEGYKRMIVEASAADIIYTPAISGIPGNFLRQSLERAGLDADNLPPRPEIDMDKEGGARRAWRDVWSAGQGVGGIDDVAPAAALVARLGAEYRAALAAAGAGPAVSATARRTA